MAQVKKKTSATTKSAAKVTVKAKKPAASRTTTQKTSEYRTLRASKSTQPFMTVKMTRQTVYWLIVAGAVLALGIWIVNLQVKINGIYDKIGENQLYYDQISELDQRIIENKKAIERGSNKE